MRLLSLVLLCFLLVSCSSTKLHLYTRYLSETEATEITKKLENANFDVVSNTLPYPDTVNESTLLYSPFIEHKEDLDNVLKLFATLGWNINSVNPLVSGNHWYKKNSIGILLLPKGLKQKDKIASQDLANIYESSNCNTSVKIQLNQNNTYQLLFDKTINKQTNHLKGTWKMRSYPYLELTSNNKMWWFYFKIEQKIIQDKVSKIEIIELHPEDKYKFFLGCSFVYGVRK